MIHQERLLRIAALITRHSTDDQQPPNVTLAHLRSLAQPLLASGRVLLWHQTKPGAEVAAPAETLHRRREGLNGHGCDRPDAGHGLQSRGHFALCRLSPQRLVQIGDFLVKNGDLIEIDCADLAHHIR